MFETISIIIVALVAILLIYAATRKNTFHIERSIDIKAPPEKLFPLINDFHEWDKWTPYNKDPAMKKTFSKNASGKGAVYAWEGNKTVGKGEIAITESMPPARVALDLHMIQPFEGRNHVVFALRPAGDATTVSWIMEGTQAYFVKLMGLFFNMDKMVGRDFEIGLANLKTLAE
jgi:Polyketide cyclase / dehydrase and lipid transport